MTSTRASGRSLGSSRAVPEIIATVLGIDHVAGPASLRGDLGIDSLTGTYIVARLLLDLGVRVSLPTLLESTTVDDFAAKVATLRKEQQ